MHLVELKKKGNRDAVLHLWIACVKSLIFFRQHEGD